MELEDLHWADSESLDFLNHLCETNRDVPLLLLAFTRPALFERRTDWRSTEGVHQRIDLLPLGEDTSSRLAGELLKKLTEMPAALRELLTLSAEGNPFYMEELVKMLIDQGAIQTGEAWQVDTERLRFSRVPPTLTGVLQARLDGLPSPEKRALQQASVIGAVFWDQALAAIEACASERLPGLVQRGLTLPRPDAALEGVREYAFHHHLLHQVTYDTVLKRARREGHAKVAQWLADLAAQGSLRAGDFLGTAAEHFEQAGDVANAAEFHARAAEQAGQRLAHDRVLAHVARALALLGDAPPMQTMQSAQAELRWRLLRARERTFDFQGRRDEQAADLDTLEQLAETLDDDPRRARVALRRSTRAMRMAERAEQESAARQCMAFAARCGDDDLRLQALRLLAASRVRRGDVEGGRALALQGLAEARSLGLRQVESRLLNTLVVAAGMQDDLVAALELNQQSVQIDREIGEARDGISLSNLGGAWANLGGLVQEQRELEAALKLLRAGGERVIESVTLGLMSSLALWSDDATRALTLARSALDIAVATRARDREVTALLRLAEAGLALGRLPEARQASLQVQARALAFGHAARFDACGGLARLALAERDRAAALAALQPLLDHAATGGTLAGTEYARQIELSAHLALAAADDPRAAEWLDRAHGALMAQAGAISDATLRQSFLQNIPHHRELVAAWVAAGSINRTDHVTR